MHQRLEKGSCDLVTVYRSLAAMEEINVVRRCDFGDGSYRYEINTGEHHHHHIICRSCHGVQTLDLCVADGLERMARQMGYSKVTHMLEIFGVCPKCQAAAGGHDLADATRCGLLRLVGGSCCVAGSLAELCAARNSDAARLRAAAQYSAAHTGRGDARDEGRATWSSRIIRTGIPPRELHKIYSGTKGFWILAALKAVGGRACSISMSVSRRRSRSGRQRSGQGAGDRSGSCSDFCSGLDAANHLHGDGFRQSRRHRRCARRSSRRRASAFIYGPAPLQVFHEVLKRKLAARGETPTQVSRTQGAAPARARPAALPRATRPAIRSSPRAS